MIKYAFEGVPWRVHVPKDVFMCAILMHVGLLRRNRLEITVPVGWALNTNN